MTKTAHWTVTAKFRHVVEIITTHRVVVEASSYDEAKQKAIDAQDIFGDETMIDTERNERQDDIQWEGSKQT